MFLSALLGGGIPIVGNLIGMAGDYMKTKQANAQSIKEKEIELLMLDKSAEIRSRELEQQAEIQADMAESKRQLAATDAIGKQNVANIQASAKLIDKSPKWVIAIQALVRPLITYTIMALMTLMCFWVVKVAPVNTVEDLRLSVELFGLIGITDAFGLVISFWFGSRVMDKARNKK